MHCPFTLRILEEDDAIMGAISARGKFCVCVWRHVDIRVECEFEP